MSDDLKFEELIKKRGPMTERDEYMHDFAKELGNFPRYHNESWYFNFIDRPNKVYFVTRLSLHMDKNKSRLLLLLIIDDKDKSYYNEISLEKMPTNWEFDDKLKYYCVKPMDEWRVKYEDKNVILDINFKGRFPVFNLAEVEDPKTILEKYGEELLKIAAQEHYEQPMIATGSLGLKKRGEVFESRDIKAYGHRDHSWGIRKWVQIDAWNWVSAQFEDETINFVKSDLLGKSPQSGVIYSKGKENEIIEKIEVNTKTKEDGKTPISSTFILTDKKGNKRTLESKTIYSKYLPLKSRTGITEIFEQVAVFTCDGKEGNGISEYLISTRD
ncbi:MAG: hypothetical protein EU532_06550 [Promethearchaeota archaeon]|nr:MAG: hypothetical protein EU532_06550 [Candidatus Lokiarchaeota archaeon]